MFGEGEFHTPDPLVGELLQSIIRNPLQCLLFGGCLFFFGISRFGRGQVFKGFGKLLADPYQLLAGPIKILDGLVKDPASLRNPFALPGELLKDPHNPYTCLDKLLHCSVFLDKAAYVHVR